MAEAMAGKGRRTARKPASRKKTGQRGRIWPWLFVLTATIGGIAAYDHREELSALLPGDHRKPAVQAASHRSPAPRQAPQPLVATPVALPVTRPVAKPTEPVAPGGAVLVGQGFSNTFYFCGTSGLDNCVASGDIFWFRKQAVHLADIVAPETERARCPAERTKGFAAKVRLRDLLNSGNFDLVDWPNSDTDSQGRKLRVVMRKGQSLGGVLIREGLARSPSESGRGWC